MNSIAAVVVVVALIVVVLLAVVANLVIDQTDSNQAGDQTLKMNPAAPSPGSESYELVMEASNYEQFRRSFVIDNPNGDGSDPTGGQVDYSAPMQRGADGAIVPNVNGNVYWGELPVSHDNFVYVQPVPGTSELRIQAAPALKEDGRAQSVRLSSRALFYGGLFVFDVTHLPVGCGVWPAMWLNGFIGAPNQYHGNPEDASYDEDMKKLATTSRLHECGPDSKNLVKRDEVMSRHLGREVKMALWPGGGEIDILEQTNFSDTNLTSLHSGPGCEVSLERRAGGGSFEIPFNYNPALKVPSWNDYYGYEERGVRSACTATILTAPTDVPWSGGAFKPFSGCPDDSAYQTEQDGGPLVHTGGWTRPRCPAFSAYLSSNTQVASPPGGWGPTFNAAGGKVVVTQWVPSRFLRVWAFPRASTEDLKKQGGPLSASPDPTTWTGRLYEENLQVSYRFDAPDTAMCSFNFMSLIINITFGGGWGSNVDPGCTWNGVTPGPDRFRDFFEACWAADPKGPGVDPSTGRWTSADGSVVCADGAKQRGAEPVFYKEAFFQLKSIRVFQRRDDQRVW